MPLTRMEAAIHKQRIAVASRIKLLIKLLRPYMWLTDAYVSDYFAKSYRDRISSRWLDLLSHLEPKELASLLTIQTWNSRKVWPLSLLAFRKAANTLCLDRTKQNKCQLDLITSPIDLLILKDNNKLPSQEIESTTTLPTNDHCIRDGQYIPLEHCYRKHVKPKKQHEILELGKVIDKVARCSRCNHVIDVGAGQGHLSRLLSFGLGLHVTTVEAAGCHVPKAEKFDREVKTDIVKGRVHRRLEARQRNCDEYAAIDVTTSKTLTSPKHVIATIEPSVPVEEFLRTLQFSKSSNTDYEDVPVINSGKDTLPIKNSDHQIDVHRNNHDHIAQEVDSVPQISVTENPDMCSRLSVVPHEHNEHDTCHEHYCKSKSSTCPCHTEMKRGQMATGVQDEEKSRIDPSLFVLTGLHACGDLTPTMLRVFKKCPQAFGLASVACCYMNMELEKTNLEQGYPMSLTVREQQFPLSYEAREMACHFCDAYHDRLLSGSDSLKAHAYRAALQPLIISRDPALSHDTIKLRIKKAHLLPMQRYAELALQKLGLDSKLSATELKIIEADASRWQEVMAFYTLRLALAPAIESLILLDRVLFLLEAGISCSLLPIFDPRVSPRNFALIAMKDILSDTL